MIKKKFENMNWPRIAIQWGVILAVVFLAFLALFKESYTPDFEAYCPFGGIQALGSYLLNNSLACTMTSAQIVMGVLLVISVILFSKLFCAYICPIGTISEWLGKLGDKLKVRFTIKGIADKLLRSLKYLLLFITLYFTFDSNELFCKEYDPYYAIVSGYDTDVTVLYATLAIAIAILGSVFIRLFWCKYLCPLGAISNLFKFAGFFIGVLLIYIILQISGVQIHYVWPLAIASAGGYIIELMGQKSRFFPIARITRNEETCTNCQLCTIKCPQGIDVASVKVVRHIDCNLCSECILVCPEKDTVQINKRRSLRWLPPIAIVGLFVIGLLLESVWEIPTIDQKWYTSEEMVDAETFTREGLKNIKCYGSSMSFASKMKRVNGIYGVATYVGTNKVKIYYDPTILNEDQVQQKLFNPSKTPIRPLAKNIKEVTVVTVLLENFFDVYDFSYLSRLLKQKTEAVGLLSEYACPVIVHIYFPGIPKISEKELIEILESKNLSYESRGKSQQVELKYEVVKDLEFDSISRGEYITLLFTPYKRKFNNYNDFDSSVVNVYSLLMGKNSLLRKRLTYLVSHISNNDGIIELQTVLNDEFKEMVEISFVDTMTNSNQIHQLLNSDTLKFTYSNGTTGKIENMFHFDAKGITKEKD